MTLCAGSSTRRIRRRGWSETRRNGRVSAVSVAPDAKNSSAFSRPARSPVRLLRRFERDALPAQLIRARSEHPRPRKGLRPRPRSICPSRSIVLFQPGAVRIGRAGRGFLFRNVPLRPHQAERGRWIAMCESIVVCGRSPFRGRGCSDRARSFCAGSASRSIA